MRKEEINVSEIAEQEFNLSNDEDIRNFCNGYFKALELITEQEQPKQESEMLKELQSYIKSKSLEELQKEWSELTSHQFDEEQPKQSLDNAVDEAVNSMEFKGMLEQVYSNEQPKQSVEEFLNDSNIGYCNIEDINGNQLSLYELLKEYTQTQRTVSDEIIYPTINDEIKVRNEAKEKDATEWHIDSLSYGWRKAIEQIKKLNKSE